MNGRRGKEDKWVWRGKLRFIMKMNEMKKVEGGVEKIKKVKKSGMVIIREKGEIEIYEIGGNGIIVEWKIDENGFWIIVNEVGKRSKKIEGWEEDGGNMKIEGFESWEMGWWSWERRGGGRSCRGM